MKGFPLTQGDSVAWNSTEVEILDISISFYVICIPAKNFYFYWYAIQ